MVRLLKTSIGLTGGLLFVACAALAQPQSQIGRPGMLNYVEGQVSVDGQAVANSQVGRLEVAPGHVLRTDDGKAEMLLTPGVFLRLASHSAVKMVSPSLSKTTVELLQGEAMVEADQLEKENHLVVLDHGANIALLNRKPCDTGGMQKRSRMPRDFSVHAAMVVKMATGQWSSLTRTAS